MRVSVSPMFNVSDDTLIARLVTVGVDGVVEVGAVGDGLELELPPQPLHMAATTMPTVSRCA